MIQNFYYPSDIAESAKSDFIKRFPDYACLFYTSTGARGRTLYNNTIISLGGSGSTNYWTSLFSSSHNSLSTSGSLTTVLNTIRSHPEIFVPLARLKSIPYTGNTKKTRIGFIVTGYKLQSTSDASAPAIRLLLANKNLSSEIIDLTISTSVWFNTNTLEQSGIIEVKEEEFESFDFFTLMFFTRAATTGKLVVDTFPYIAE